MAALTTDEIIARQLQDEEDSLYAQQVAIELASSEQMDAVPGLAELDDSAQVIDLTADDSPPPALRQVYRRVPLFTREVPAPQRRAQGHADLAEPALADEERDFLEALERSRRDVPPWGGRGHGDLEPPLPGEGGVDVDPMSHEELVQLEELMGKVPRLRGDELDHYTTGWTVDKVYARSLAVRFIAETGAVRRATRPTAECAHIRSRSATSPAACLACTPSTSSALMSGCACMLRVPRAAWT